MPTIQITGTVQNAAGVGVDQIVTRLSPKSEAASSAQAIGGIGLLTDPVEILTDGSGVFSHTAIAGFRYRLEIPAISYDREFVAPATDVRFDLLGLVPFVETAARGGIREDADADDIPDAGGDEIEHTFLVIKADPVATILERYTHIHLERSTKLADSYVEITVLELIEGKTFYEYTDVAAPDDEVYYRAIYKQVAPGADVSQYSNSVSTNVAVEEDLLISVDELKEIYLFGADLTRDDGTPFPRRMFEHYIKAGAEWLSKELDIPLLPVNVVNEEHDHYSRDYSRWGYFQLDNYPIIQVDRVWFQYPAMNEEVEINRKWVVVEEGGESGVLQIVPGEGSINDVLLIPGHLIPLWSGTYGRVPGIWHFDYRAGFEVNSVPADIKHILGMKASIDVLNIAGDLIAGAGIATKSVSVPGLNQSIGTTASATNSGYGARVIQYTKQITEMLPNLRRYYGKGTRMVVV